MQAVQKAFSAGMVPLLKAAEICKVSKNSELISLMKDSVIMLGHDSFVFSQKRRFLMRSTLPKKFSEICNTSQPVSEKLLFGNEVGK